MDNEIGINLLLNLKTIVIYLILILFLIDLAKADSYNKISFVGYFQYSLQKNKYWPSFCCTFN